MPDDSANFTNPPTATVAPPTMAVPYCIALTIPEPNFSLNELALSEVSSMAEFASEF